MKTFRQVMLSLLVALCCIGCAETSFIRSPAKLMPGARKPQPARVLCLWEEALGQGLDDRTSRGFAGQILFFGYGQATPIPVHGTVRIYQYDDYDPEDLDPKPIHVFVFDDVGWNAHRADSTVGDSYNVFLPYVKRHRETAHCALKVEFIPEDGRPVSSPVTEITLKARKSRSRRRSARTPDSTKRDSAASAPAPASATSAAPPEADRLDSLTIPLPRTSQQ